MKRREIEQRFDDIVEFSGVERFIDTPVKRYSSGMYVRLAFAVAAHLEPEILLRGRGALGRRRRVPAALSRAHGGARQHGPDGCLRLPRAAGRSPSSATARSGSTADAGRRRAGRRGDRQLPAPDPRGGQRAVWTAGVRAGQRPREDPRDPGAAATKECLRVSWTCASRSGSRSGSKCCARESRSSRRSRCSTRRARSPSTRWTPTSAGSSRPSRATYVATAWIPGNLLNEGSAIVEAAICSLDFPKLEHHAAVYEARVVRGARPGRRRLGTRAVQRAVARCRTAASRLDVERTAVR